MAKRKSTSGGVVDSGKTYTLEQFFKAAGIGRTTVRRGVELGVELPTHEVGRRLFVDGDEGRQYLKDLAAAQRVEKQRAQSVA